MCFFFSISKKEHIPRKRREGLLCGEKERSSVPGKGKLRDIEGP